MGGRSTVGSMKVAFNWLVFVSRYVPASAVFLRPDDCFFRCRGVCVGVQTDTSVCWDVSQSNISHPRNEANAIYINGYSDQTGIDKVLQTFPNNLQYLMLARSNVSLEKTFARLKQGSRARGIYELVLVNCSLLKIPQFGWEKFTRLSDVYMQRNGFEDIQPAMFMNLASLQTLAIEDDGITKIVNHTFVNLPNIYKLSLNRNKINMIEEGAFDSVPELYEVYLCGNELLHIPVASLQNLLALEILDLSNQISYISSDIVKLKKISKLDLSSNQISYVSSDIVKLKKISKLVLRFNQIYDISPSIVDLQSLRALYLSMNLLQSLPSTMIMLAKSDGFDMELGGNPWTCDCRIIWLVEWCQQQGSDNNDGYFVMPNCTNPVFQSMADIDVNDTVCVSSLSAEPTGAQDKMSMVKLPFLLGLCSIPIVVVVTIVAASLLRMRRNRRNFQRIQFVDNNRYDIPEGEEERTTSIGQDSEEPETVTEITFSFDRPSQGKLRLGKMIGQGAFGQVFEGFASGLTSGVEWTKVAVKKLKEQSTTEDVEMLRQELEQMANVGKHPNIVDLYGSGFIKGSSIIIMEYATKGDLLSYLRVISKELGEYIENCCNQGTETVLFKYHRELFLFAWQIAKGMAHLSRMKVVHRDLAARNILLTDMADGLVAKISDFGLTRDVYEEGVYCKHTSGRLPYKWMSPEALLSGKYSVKGDVWSYGILLWEITTLGSTPYPGIPAEILMEMHKTGYQMPKPPMCPDNVYKLMSNCWNVHPALRPNFDEIVRKLDFVTQTGTQTEIYGGGHDVTGHCEGGICTLLC